MLFSLMQQQKKFVLEIKKINKLQELSEKEGTFFVYDIAEWKLTSAHANTDTHLLEKKLSLLAEIKNNSQKAFGVLVGSPEDAEKAALHANFLYLPGEVCRQSDVLEACAKTGLPLIVEKGKFLAPNDIQRLLDKLKNVQVALVECGTSYGYSDVILDPRSLLLLKETGKYFGINLNALVTSTEETVYSHHPQWLNNNSFTNAFTMVGDTFGASFYVK